MATFIATSSYAISGTFADGSLDHTIPTSRIGINLAQAYTSGTGANQANQWFADTRTLAGSAESLDLFGGLTDDFGTTINFTAIKELVIRSQSTTSSEVISVFGNWYTGNIGTSAVVDPSGLLIISSPIDGHPVTNSSKDILTLDPNLDTITYDIFLIGTV